MGVNLSNRAYRNRTAAAPKTSAVAVGIFLLLSVPAGGISAGEGAPGSDPSWFVDMNRYMRGAHASLTCEQCHGTMIEEGKKHPDLKDSNALRREATRSYDYQRCRSCHRLAFERYEKGVHAKALREELSGAAKPSGEKPRKAPVCGDCHSAHYDRAGLSRVETGRKMTGVCGACHEPQERTYLKDYHGRTGVYLGDEKSAYCTDCHGAHTAVSLKEKDRAVRACARCHPKAEARFTSFVVHASPAGVAEKAPDKQGSTLLIHRVKVIASIVVGVFLFFFFGHAFLWMLREIHEKLRK